MIVKQTENSIHEQITFADSPKSPIYKASIYSGKPFYKDNYTDKKEEWKSSDPTSFIDNKDSLIYDRLPIEVQVFKNEKIGYQIRCKKTNSIKRVTLLKVGDVDVSKSDLGKSDISSIYKFVPEFEVSELGVRLWKNIEKEGPQSFEWLVEDDGIGNLCFREEPDAFDKETCVKVPIITSKTLLDTTSYLFKEDLKSASEASKEGLKVDTDFYNSDNYYVYNVNLTYSTSRSTSGNSADSNIYVGQNYEGSLYSVWRSFIKFDTSSLLDGSILIDATLGLAITTNNSTTDFDVDIVKQDWYSQDPIGAGNREAAYDGCLGGTKDVTWRNTSGASVDTRYTSPSLDVSQINKAYYTYYSLRSSRDYAGTTPSGNEYIIMYPVSAAEGYRPMLSVDWVSQGSVVLI